MIDLETPIDVIRFKPFLSLDGDVCIGVVHGDEMHHSIYVPVAQVDEFCKALKEVAAETRRRMKTYTSPASPGRTCALD